MSYDFGVLGGQRFIVCAVCHGVIALPDWQHVSRTQCQGPSPDMLRAINEVLQKCDTLGPS